MGPASGSLKGRLWAAAIVASLAVVAALVVVVFKFGRYDPSPPSLVDHPNVAIPGEILYFDGQGCIWRAAASGATRSQVYCAGFVGSRVTWIDGKTIATAGFKGAGSDTWTKIDLETRLASETGISARFDGPTTIGPRGESVAVESNGDVVMVSGGSRTKIVHFDVAEYRVPAFATWSPDGEWFLLNYWSARNDEQELWVVSRDGKTAGTLLRGQFIMGPSPVSWWIDGVGYWPPVSELTSTR